MGPNVAPPSVEALKPTSKFEFTVLSLVNHTIYTLSPDMMTGAPRLGRLAPVLTPEPKAAKPTTEAAVPDALIIAIAK
jgi:hypothetical protein